MDDGSFPVEVISGVPVMTAPRELDITNAPQLESALRATARHGDGTLVVDMSRTLFCDCATLHRLLAARDRLRADGGDLLLVIGGPAVLRVFQLTGADLLIRNVTSLEEALAQASPAGPGDHRRADDAAGAGDGHGPGQRGMSGLDRQAPDRARRQSIPQLPGRRQQHLSG